MLYKRYATGSIELKADKANRTVEGYASVFNVLDHDFDIIVPGAFANTLERRGERVKLLWQHDPSSPIGKPTKMQEDGKGLAVSAKVSATDKGDEALTLVEDGVVDSFSIGYNVLRREILERDASAASILGALGGEESSLASDLTLLTELASKVATAPWRVRVLKELELFEFSLVTFPANEAAVVTGVKNAQLAMQAISAKVGPDAEKNLRELLVALGTPAYLLDADPDERLAKSNEPGSPEESKAGKVLSKANFEKLDSAHKAIGAVLAAATPEPEPDADAGDGGDKNNNDELDVKSVLELVRDTFNPRNFTGSAG